jgi:hypothetical protein
MEFERINGVEMIENLQGHKNTKVYEMCASLLKEFGDAEVI